MNARFVRLAERERAKVSLMVDGEPIEALQGDTLMVALLTRVSALRESEFDPGSRAGFCLMGACQDCWVRLQDGRRVRACSTFLESGQCVTRDPGRQP